MDLKEPAMTQRRLGGRGKVKNDAKDTVDGEIIVFDSGEEIPETFDVREAFPECSAIVGRIRDQSDCGSCWAFASTEAFNDRRCIAGAKEGRSRGLEEVTADKLVMLSAEDTTACCWGFSCGLRWASRRLFHSSAWLKAPSTLAYSLLAAKVCNRLFSMCSIRRCRLLPVYHYTVCFSLFLPTFRDALPQHGMQRGPAELCMALVHY